MHLLGATFMRILLLLKALPSKTLYTKVEREHKWTNSQELFTSFSHAQLRATLVSSIPTCFLFSPLLFLIFFNFYFWHTERQSMSGGEAEREGDTELEAGSRLRAVGTEPDTWLEPRNHEIHEIMTQAEVRHLTDGATQAPQSSPLYSCINWDTKR